MFPILDRTILIALAGSRAYGLATPNSDCDYRGICIAEPKYYLGLSNFEQKDNGWDEIKTPKFSYLEKDTVIYDIRKFFKLAIKANPIILEMMFVDDFAYITEFGKKIYERRNDFLSKEVMYSYGGYAVDQVKKCESHRKWLLEPPVAPPKLEDYGLTEKTVVSKSETHAFYNYLFELSKMRLDYMQEILLIKEELRQKLDEYIDFKQILIEGQIPDNLISYVCQLTDCPPNYMERLQKTNNYNAAVKRWQSYNNWKNNRNPKRAELENKIKYDSKHMMHCVRLLKTAIEILEGKGLIVNRKIAGDSEELLAIRNGNISYENILELVKDYQAKLNKAHKESLLPDKSDRNQLEQLCVDLITQFNFS